MTATFGFEFHSPDFTVPTDVVDYAAAKLESKLAKFTRRVLAVTVHVKDVNGHRHGDDLTCHIEAHMVGLEPVNVSETDHDLRAVIDRASDELAQAVQRHTERVRTRRRNRGRKLVRHAKLGV